MKTLKITTTPTLINKEQGYVNAEIDYGPALYRGQIKIRGNSTAFGFKKPFAIKLNTTAHLLNGEDDSYILLANCYDPTQMRNCIALQMAQNLGIDYTPKCKYVDVYLNNEYKGLYLLTDSVMDKVDGDFLIEAEQWDNPDSTIKYAISNNGRKYKIIFNHNADITKILNEMESGDLSNVDIESLAKYYVLQEFFKNADVGVASTIFYGKNDKLLACCPWDFDLSSGNYNAEPGMYDSLYVNGDSANGLFATKMYPDAVINNEEFISAVKNVYKYILPWIENIPTLIDWIITTYKDVYDKDIIDQGVAYSQYQIKPLGTIKNNIDFLKDWFERRNNYLKKEILSDEV